MTLKDKNKCKEIEFFKSNYIASKNVNAWLGLFEVKKQLNIYLLLLYKYFFNPYVQKEITL